MDTPTRSIHHYQYVLTPNDPETFVNDALALNIHVKRSDHSQLAAELVRNGRIGQVKRVLTSLGRHGLRTDINTWQPMPVPEGFDYNMWLGSTPSVYYTEKRVHSQTDITSRPGWLRCEQFGAGMITGWGAHHVDTAHWGMGTEYTGPIEIEGSAEFPKKGLWNVHGSFKNTAKYANGVIMHLSGDYPNGVNTTTPI